MTKLKNYLNEVKRIELTPNKNNKPLTYKNWTDKTPTKNGYYFVITLNESNIKIINGDMFIVEVINNGKSIKASFGNMSMKDFTGQCEVQGAPRIWNGPIKISNIDKINFLYNVLKKYKENNPQRLYSEYIYPIEDYKL